MRGGDASLWWMCEVDVVGLCELSWLDRMTGLQVFRWGVFGCTDGCCAARVDADRSSMLLSSLELGQRSAPRAAVCVSLRFSV